MGESESASSWKDMVSKALASMRGFEKEIAHKDREIRNLLNRVKVLEAKKVGEQLPSAPLFDLNGELQSASVSTREQKPLMEDVKALKSKLEATEAHLHTCLALNGQLEEEKNNEKNQQAVVNAAFDSLKTEVEAVLSESEEFKAEAVRSMKALTSDVRQYQVVSDQKLKSLRDRLEALLDLQSVQSKVLRTIAGEQKALHQIRVARVAMQHTTAASLQQLAQLEQICATKVQKAFNLVDFGRYKMADNNHEHMPQRLGLLEGMAKKHKKDLTDVEKKLLSSLTVQINSRKVGSEDNDVANLERGFVHHNDERSKTISMAGVHVEKMSTAASTCAGQQSCRQADPYIKDPYGQWKRKFESCTQQSTRNVEAKLSPLPNLPPQKSFW